MSKEDYQINDYLRVLVFFDLFSHPLTLAEFHRFLPIKTSLDILEKELETLSILENKAGLYFLKNHQEILIEAQKRKISVARKMRRARLVASFFRFLPWVEMMAVTNFKGEDNLRDGSDIDFFIVSSAGRIWLTRFFCAGAMKLLGWRPQGEKVRDRICLSFYVDMDNLSLERFKLTGDDIDFIYWLANFVPIYEKKKTLTKFWQANTWLKNYLPNWSPASLSKDYSVSSWSGFDFLKIGKLGDFWENWAHNYQWRIMPSSLRDKINQGVEVVVETGVLKLHAHDKRRQHQSEFEEKLKKIYAENIGSTKKN